MSPHVSLKVNEPGSNQTSHHSILQQKPLYYNSDCLQTLNASLKPSLLINIPIGSGISGTPTTVIVISRPVGVTIVVAPVAIKVKHKRQITMINSTQSNPRQRDHILVGVMVPGSAISFSRAPMIALSKHWYHRLETSGEKGVPHIPRIHTWSLVPEFVTVCPPEPYP